MNFDQEKVNGLFNSIADFIELAFIHDSYTKKEKKCLVKMLLAYLILVACSSDNYDK